MLALERSALPDFELAYIPMKISTAADRLRNLATLTTLNLRTIGTAGVDLLTVSLGMLNVLGCRDHAFGPDMLLVHAKARSSPRAT